MALNFYADPPRIVLDTLEVPFFGQDGEEYVECRVSHSALMACFDAKGIAGDKLFPVFEKNRERIEEAARRKYDAGNFERKDDRILLQLGLEDFRF